MKGKKLQTLVKASGLSAEVVAERLGIGRPHLYNLYKKEDIGGVYAEKVKEIGLLKYDTTEQKGDINLSIGLTASQWMKMWEDEKKGRENDRALFERVLTVMEKDLAKFRDLVKVRN